MNFPVGTVKRSRIALSAWFITCVAVLALNDHLLKGLFHNSLTGKLSDFAGIVVVAVLLFIASGSTRLAIGSTAIGFTAIKVSYTAATWSAPFLGGVTRQDATDLVALLALWPAWFLMTRYKQSTFEPPHNLHRRTRGTELRESARIAARVFAIAAAGVVCSATSLADAPEVTNVRVDANRRVLARVAGAEYASEDGGAMFRVFKSSIAGEVATSPPVLNGCSSAGECYRIENFRVERRASNGPWTVDFAYTKDQIDRFASAFDNYQGYGQLLQGLVVVDRSDGAHVVVNNGSNGVAHRSPDGRWKNVRIGSLRDRTAWHFSFQYFLPLSLVMLLLSWLPLLRRHRSQTVMAAMVVVNVLVGLFLVGLTLIVWVAGGRDFTNGLGRIMLIAFAVWVAVQALWFRNVRAKTLQ